MTRLVTKDIESIIQEIRQLDRSLHDSCGSSLFEIAAFASGGISRAKQGKTVGVVPITAGEGVIEGFTQSVAGILEYLGAEIFHADGTDVNGFYQCMSQCESIIMADDDRYISVDLRTQKVSENGDATGRGFAAALLLMAKDVNGKEVLVAGAGDVGKSAAAFLQRHGADILLYDTNPERLRDSPYRTTTDISHQKFSLIVEATTSPAVIREEHVSDDVYIAAPGMPLGVEKGLAKKLTKENRLVHNPLELGTAVMYTDLLV